MRIERELMRGAGPMAVMQLLAARERYGYELVEALAKQTNGVLAMGQSTLYPLLYNLQAKELITSRLDDSASRPRRYYRLTNKGRKRLARDLSQWQSLLRAMQGLGLNPAGGAA